MKLDYLVMGHRCPHLHCHVYPQYEDCDPYGLVDITAGQVRLSGEELSERISDLRECLMPAGA